MYIDSWENLGCNFFCTKKIPCRKHTDAHRGLKVARKHSARAGPDSTRARERTLNLKDETIFLIQ